MKRRRYVVYDVFTSEALTGNPLAVVLDCDGLDTDGMQRIAREFNLSESTFVLPPEDSRHKARVRIFTPNYELPFAGHPTVGTAIALADLSGSAAPSIFVLEENIGPVRCAVGHVDGVAFAEFALAKLPEPVPFSVDPAIVASALGLGPHEIGFENHRVSCWTAGVPYVAVPVSGLDIAAKVRFDNAAWMEISPAKSGSAVASAYVYCRETIHHDTAFHARMFVPGNPSYEDPATGSAAAAFAGAIVRFDRPVDGSSQYWIEQGIEMGRPSRIRLEIDTAQGEIEAARIGGQAVKVAEGTLFA
ncbi:PhzF family phenazine biosynthesis protein [Mesorhizobium sp. LHD-90]|uniref:PhzF family phenazine biosynthesis protein n=1 Tax=Mesorhizobium sp. LHD-90 TaxID=3071414 RepID=UPI0027DED150|nr:PhzF family phenazine biosynthesis protein [Mesorhizobium sp. LHD-90]MDQ6433577.1 PhzF family phenazine biosynthesis protein [Mesorhizobium sp. LHD-90]